MAATREAEHADAAHISRTTTPRGYRRRQPVSRTKKKFLELKLSSLAGEGEAFLARLATTARRIRMVFCTDLHFATENR